MLSLWNIKLTIFAQKNLMWKHLWFKNRFIHSRESNSVCLPHCSVIKSQRTALCRSCQSVKMLRTTLAILVPCSWEEDLMPPNCKVKKAAILLFPHWFVYNDTALKKIIKKKSSAETCLPTIPPQVAFRQLTKSTLLLSVPTSTYGSLYFLNEMSSMVILKLLSVLSCYCHANWQTKEPQLLNLKNLFRLTGLQPMIHSLTFRGQP